MPKIKNRNGEVLYGNLRGLMAVSGYDQTSLGEAIGRSCGYVCMRMRGKSEWTLADVYKMMDIFELTWAEVPIFFPAAGHDTESMVKRMRDGRRVMVREAS